MAASWGVPASIAGQELRRIRLIGGVERTMERVVLDNGLTAITELRPHTQTVSIHVGVRAGPPQEEDRYLGISHFLEHMLFKGTTKSTAEELSAVVEGNGGVLNGFTEHEFTEFFVTMLSKNWESGFDVLAEMITQPALDPECIDRERSVVLEEIQQAKDDAETCVWDRFHMRVWKDYAVSKPVLGKTETVENISRAALEEHYHRFYVPENMCLVVVGNVNEEPLWERIKSLNLNGKLTPFVNRRPYADMPEALDYRRDCHQANIVMGVDITPLSIHHSDRFPMALYNVILGGNASSRLFLEIREKRGLAYSIASDVGLLDRNGFFAVSAAMHPSKMEQVTTIINEEIARSLTTSPDAADVERAKNFILGILANNLESNHSSGRRSLICGLFGEDPSVQHFITQLENVTPEEIRACAERYVDPAKLVTAAIVPANDSGD